MLEPDGRIERRLRDAGFGLVAGVDETGRGALAGPLVACAVILPHDAELVLGLNRAALAEGLAFARRCGLDASAVLDILRTGAAYSRVMDAKGAKMIGGDFSPEAKLAQHVKDVRLILETGSRSGASRSRLWRSRRATASPSPSRPHRSSRRSRAIG